MASARITQNVDNNKLIYGVDNRYEVDDYFDRQFIEKAQSVALRVPSKRLNIDPSDDQSIIYNSKTLKEMMPQLCANERYVNQKSLGECSGFLVASNKLVTAGHCVPDLNSCRKNQWVFGFKKNTEKFSIEDVYSCKKIINQKYQYSKYEVSDYAIIELDREVTRREPLAIRKHGIVLPKTPILTIGHPMGLPMKITDGAEVKRQNKLEKESPLVSFYARGHYFTANLDVYAGNSGSPVFNQNTGKVEGIIIQGAEDFIYNEKEQCMQSNHLSDNRLNSFEKVMRITKIPGL